MWLGASDEASKIGVASLSSIVRPCALRPLHAARVPPSTGYADDVQMTLLFAGIVGGGDVGVAGRARDQPRAASRLKRSTKLRSAANQEGASPLLHGITVLCYGADCGPRARWGRNAIVAKCRARCIRLVGYRPLPSAKDQHCLSQLDFYPLRSATDRSEQHQLSIDFLCRFALHLHRFRTGSVPGLDRSM